VITECETQYDLFLSYNSLNAVAVEKIARILKESGLSVWFDQWELKPGDNFLQKLQEQLNKIHAVVICIGSNDIGPWQTKEMELALIRSTTQRCLVIPVLLPGASANPSIPGFLKPFVWVDLRDGISKESLAKLVQAICATNPITSIPPCDVSEYDLYDILRSAQKRLIISGHTINKFAQDRQVIRTLNDLLYKGVKVSIIQLNPHSQYAKAHKPYHQLESTSSSDTQYEKTLNFYTHIFGLLDDDTNLKNFEVLFSNYMPRYRAIIVDDDVYLYLYTYGMDVGHTPDLILNANNDSVFPFLRAKVIHSIELMQSAAEIIPYIRDGHLYDYWQETRLARWDTWSKEERYRHKLTYDFYVTYAKEFDIRFGGDPEPEVKEHLRLMRNRTLVIGCGSGREIDFLADQRCSNDLYGIDLSPKAIHIANSRKIRHAEFYVGDFYDLPYITKKTFDSIVANAAFVHLFNRDDIDTLLQFVFDKLNPGGQFFLRTLYKEADCEPISEELFYSNEWAIDRWFVYYSRLELQRRCTDVGFLVLEDTTREIAKRVYHPDEERLEAILTKGFPHHIYHDRVFWPTLLLKKPI